MSEEETALELQKSWKIKAKHTRAHKAHSLVYREILKAYLTAHAFPCIYIQYSIFSTAVGEDPNDAFEQRRENPNVSGHAENPVFRGQSVRTLWSKSCPRHHSSLCRRRGSRCWNLLESAERRLHCEYSSRSRTLPSKGSQS